MRAVISSSSFYSLPTRRQNYGILFSVVFSPLRLSLSFSFHFYPTFYYPVALFSKLLQRDFHSKSPSNEVLFLSACPCSIDGKNKSLCKQGRRVSSSATDPLRSRMEGTKPTKSFPAQSTKQTSNAVNQFVLLVSSVSKLDLWPLHLVTRESVVMATILTRFVEKNNNAVSYNCQCSSMVRTMNGLLCLVSQTLKYYFMRPCRTWAITTLHKFQSIILLSNVFLLSILFLVLFSFTRAR